MLLLCFSGLIYMVHDKPARPYIQRCCVEASFDVYMCSSRSSPPNKDSHDRVKLDEAALSSCTGYSLLHDDCMVLVLVRYKSTDLMALAMLMLM